MLRHRLRSLNELDVAEAAKDIVLSSTFTPSISITSIDLNLAKALSSFDPSDLY